MDYPGGAQEALQKVQEAHEEQTILGIKTYKVFWTVFFGIIFIIIFLVVYLIFTGGHKNISNNKLMEGVAVEVGESDVIQFKLDEEEHGMKINLVGDDMAEITISSDPINLTLKLNEVKEVDLNNDGIVDIKIRLVKIEDGKATIAIIRIQKEACQENWKCSEWNACSNGRQSRTCGDLNNCGTIFDKPLLKQECLKATAENQNALESGTNNSVNTNNTLNQDMNKTIETNLSDQTHVFATNTTNVSDNHQENNTDSTSEETNSYHTDNTTTPPPDDSTGGSDTGVVCPSGTYACYESEGFFCGEYYDSNNFNPFCCPRECLRFESKEQFCSSRGYSSFTGNETHICKVQVYSPFNGTDIVCCDSIGPRTTSTVNTGGLSS